MTNFFTEFLPSAVRLPSRTLTSSLSFSSTRAPLTSTITSSSFSSTSSTSSEKTASSSNEEAVPPPPPPSSSSAEATPPPPPPAAATSDGNPLSEAEALTAELNERLLRTLAESENVRRRAQIDVANAKLYGQTSFARELLEVADNLGLALESVPEEKAKDDALLSSLREGVAATERILNNVFNSHGITRTEVLGEKFDPEFHQAFFEVEDKAKEPGTIAVVTKPGYMIKDRVLRHAVVGVVKKS